MSTRVLGTMFVVLCGTLLCGCRQSTQSKPQEAASLNSPVEMSTIADVTVDSLKAKLGADFTVQSEGPPLVLVRKIDPHEILILVAHNPRGQVESIAAYVLGPKDSLAKIDELYRGVVQSVSAAVGVTSAESLGAYADMGLVYTQMNFPYGFELDGRYCELLPNRTLDKKSTEFTFRENFVHRDLRVIPSVGGSVSARMPIPGASREQLESLLEGFTVKSQVAGQSTMFIRTQPTHTDVVVCGSDDKGRIMRVEAFVANLQGDADLAKLNEQLWVEVAGLEYKDCNAQKAIEFLTGPKLAYAAGDGRLIGAATYFLPAEHDGTRRRLTIYASDL